jgi:hypothetical protein
VSMLSCSGFCSSLRTHTRRWSCFSMSVELSARLAPRLALLMVDAGRGLLQHCYGIEEGVPLLSPWGQATLHGAQRYGLRRSSGSVQGTPGTRLVLHPGSTAPASCGQNCSRIGSCGHRGDLDIHQMLWLWPFTLCQMLGKGKQHWGSVPCQLTKLSLSLSHTHTHTHTHTQTHTRYPLFT